MTLRILLPVISVQQEQQLKTMELSTSGNVVGTSYPELNLCVHCGPLNSN